MKILVPLIALAALSPTAPANVPAKDLATLVVGVDLQQRRDPHLNVEDDGELVTITVWPRLGERPSETERRGRDAIEKWRRRNPWQKAPFYSSLWSRKSDGRIYALYIHLYYGTCAPPLLPVPAPPSSRP